MLVMRNMIVLSMTCVVISSCSSNFRNKESGVGHIKSKSLYLEHLHLNPNIQSNVYELELYLRAVDSITLKKKDTIGSIIPISNIPTAVRGVVKVDLQNELLRLFDPANFICGVSPKLSSKLKKVKINGKPLGFIPHEVQTAITKREAFLISEAGSNVLAHTFSYNIDNYIHRGNADSAPTVTNFTETDYIIIKSNGPNSFFYSVDCSGYLSAALSVAGGVGENDLKSSASNAASTSKSLVVISGIFKMPLYMAYKGTDQFGLKSQEVLDKRIKTLQAILNAIPNYHINDDLVINLDVDNSVVLISNSGTSKFNGKADLAISGGASFGVGSVNGNSTARADVTRSSLFTNYSTYILERNITNTPDRITVKMLKDLITNLQNEFTMIKP